MAVLTSPKMLQVPHREQNVLFRDLQPILSDLQSINTELVALEETANNLPTPIPAGSYTVVSVTVTPYNVTPTSGDYIYLVNTIAAGGNVILNFPSAVGNTAFYGVKKIDAGVGTVTLTPFGGQTIDGAGTQVMLFQKTEVNIFSDNANLILQ